MQLNLEQVVMFLLLIKRLSKQLVFAGRLIGAGFKKPQTKTSLDKWILLAYAMCMLHALILFLACTTELNYGYGTAMSLIFILLALPALLYHRGKDILDRALEQLTS